MCLFFLWEGGSPGATGRVLDEKHVILQQQICLKYNISRNILVCNFEKDVRNDLGPSQCVCFSLAVGISQNVWKVRRTRFLDVYLPKVN